MEEVYLYIDVQGHQRLTHRRELPGRLGDYATYLLNLLSRILLVMVTRIRTW